MSILSSGSQFSSSTTRSSVTWLRRNTEGSYPYWWVWSRVWRMCIWTGNKYPTCWSLIVCRMKSVWGQEKQQISPSWRDLRRRWETTLTLSRELKYIDKNLFQLKWIIYLLILIIWTTFTWTNWAFVSLFFGCRHKLADKMTRKTLERGDFRLLHYAGEVTYCVVGKRRLITQTSFVWKVIFTWLTAPCLMEF